MIIRRMLTLSTKPDGSRLFSQLLEACPSAFWICWCRINAHAASVMSALFTRVQEKKKSLSRPCVAYVLKCKEVSGRRRRGESSGVYVLPR